MHRRKSISGLWSWKARVAKMCSVCFASSKSVFLIRKELGRLMLMRIACGSVSMQK